MQHICSAAFSFHALPPSLCHSRVSHIHTTSAHVSNDTMQYQRAFRISTIAKSLGKFRLLFARYLRTCLNLLDKWVPCLGELSHEPYLPGVMEPTS